MTTKIILVGHKAVELSALRLNAEHNIELIVGDIEKEKVDWEKIMEDKPVRIPIKAHDVSKGEVFIDEGGLKSKSARNIRRENKRKEYKFKKKYR